MTPIPDTGALRRQIYTVMIVLASGMALGRILSAELVVEPSLDRKWPTTRPAPMPTFSSNDRSRWATVRALVDGGTYVIGRRDQSRVSENNKYGDEGIVFEDGYKTVDKVLNPETREFYSSKPPLLPTLLAGEYWLIKKSLGWSISDYPWSVVRIIVLTFNWLPWIFYLILLARLVERYGITDWGRMVVMAAGCFATLMTPFLISINNHTIGAVSTLAAIYFAARIWEGAGKGLGEWRFAAAGFFAAFTVTNELPAAAFAGGLGLLLLWRCPRPTLVWFLPAAAIPVSAFLLTNYLALGEWGVAYSKFGGPWYEYEGSHWAKKLDERHGIDWAGDKETRLEYAIHVLIGHHGLFSLTPFFLLSLAGMIGGTLRAFRTLSARVPRDHLDGASNSSGAAVARPRTRLWAGFSASSLLLSFIVVGFYLLTTTNYGGWSCGPRWLIWLTPFFLICALPIADRLGAWRSGRVVCYLLLAVSVLSASYPAWNPWRHPWIYSFMDAQGWIPY